ncbi:MAG: 23S rRNA (adenine(2503)-C(2))-methyltransferase RlmN [Treponema sp.]|nr:23S rRNA (adenine(2503)-C(2))-methyltransferase RlmN [Treponema sp.]
MADSAAIDRKLALAGLVPEEIVRCLNLTERYRGRQILSWIARGVSSFDAMTDLGAALRKQLAEHATLRSCTVRHTLHDADGTVKLQIALHDGYLIEAVLLVDHDGRKTACVSSQAGCALGCAFCKTGTLGLARNLDAAEIVEQFLFLEAVGGTLDNVVFMGMGEPLENIDAVRRALTVLSHPQGRALSLRRVTVSTAGIISGIYDLADRGPAVRLALSLTSADPALRIALMPIARREPLDDLRTAVAYYAQKTGKRVTLEVVVLGGKNTGADAAQLLAAFAAGIPVNVNLIPWNPVAGLPFTEPDAREVLRFAHLLTAHGITVTRRMRRGQNICGACGQLGSTARTPEREQ